MKLLPTSAGKVQLMESRVVYLMYHELEMPRRPLCQSDPGYVRYVLHAASFRAQMQRLKDIGWQGFNVTQALGLPAKGVAVTFDDGSETDLLTAAPILKEFNFGATFYLTAARLNTKGYLSSQQLTELAKLGFEIGCHSMTHAYLTDLNDADMKREIVDAKVFLEELLKRNVDHFSCPGGRYNRRVADTAKLAGYKSVATSHIHANSKSTSPFELGRVAVKRGIGLPDFESLCRGQSLWKMRLSNDVRHVAQNILGNSLYDRLRSVALREPGLAQDKNNE